MFGFGRKKSQLEKAIERDGIEHATDRVSEIVDAKIPNSEIAYRFILEEIEGASMGNNASKTYAKSSGIRESEYKGAMRNSIPEVDGPDGPQQLLAAYSMELAGNQELMTKFRCMVGDKIMRKYQLGKYGERQGFQRKPRESQLSLSSIVPKSHDTGFVFVNVTNDLGAAAERIMGSTNHIKMAYGYARRAAAAALHIQGIIDEDGFQHVCGIFKSLQALTEHSVEFQEAAGAEATKFIQSYNSSVSGLFLKYLMQIATQYEVGERQLSDSELIKAVMDHMYRDQEVSNGVASNQPAELRFIDYVDQLTSTPLGPFANMMEDVRSAATKPEVLRNPKLAAAAGYSMEIAVAGLWVAGGVHHKLIEDAIGAIFAFKADIGDDRASHQKALEQSLELTNLYVPGVTAQHYAVLVAMSRELERFREEGEPVLDASEVLRRAER